MDILYVLGNGSKWQDNELRYSLRSIAKFGRNVGKVFLCGTHKPEFVSDKVVFHKCEQKKNDSARNICESISAAVQEFGLTGEFLLSSDDHFYVKETDFDNYPIYIKGMLPSEISSGVYGGREYTQTLVNTHRLLTALKLPTVNYAQHANTHFNGAKWTELADVLNLTELLPHGIEVTCLMLNYTKAEGIKRKDCKIKWAKDHADLLSQIGDSEVFSIYDSAIVTDVSAYLCDMFPDRCEFETL